MRLFKPAIAVAAMTAAVAAASAPFEPVGPWTVAGQAAQCRLSRDFQQKGRAAKLLFETLPLTNDVQVIIETTGESPPLGWSNAVLIAGDTKKLRTVSMRWLLGGDKVHHYGRLWITKEEFDKLSSSLGFGLAQQDWIAAFQLPQFADGAHAFHDCERKVFDDVASRIGLSNDEASKIQRPAELPMVLMRVTGSSDKLPPGHDIEDEAVAVYIVGPAGEMIGCAVVQTANAEELNAHACHSWGPTPFAPARDATGRPVKGLSFERSSW